MILKNFKTITPTRRFIFFYKPYIQSPLRFKYLFNKLCSKYTIKNSKKHFKSTHTTGVKKYPQIIYTYLHFKMFSAILSKFFLHPQKQKLFVEFKDSYNFTYVTPAINHYFAGYKFQPTNFKINQPFLLLNVPDYSQICLISYNIFKKILFCKSSGSFATKLLFTKKNKLALITLPSTKQKFISNISTCILGTIFDLKTNICWRGKFKNKLNLKINVRGVAMNPVDHPNGGRTKAKQPEKSPWGWIAKHNK